MMFPHNGQVLGGEKVKIRWGNGEFVKPVLSRKTKIAIGWIITGIAIAFVWIWATSRLVENFDFCEYGSGVCRGLHRPGNYC